MKLTAVIRISRSAGQRARLLIPAVCLICLAACVSRYAPSRGLLPSQLLRLSRTGKGITRPLPPPERRFEPPAGMTVELPMLYQYRPGMYRPVLALQIYRRRLTAELRSGFLGSVMAYPAAAQARLHLFLRGEGRLAERVVGYPVLPQSGSPRALVALAGVIRMDRMRMYDSFLQVLDDRCGMRVFPDPFRPVCDTALGYDFIRAFNYVVADPRVGMITLSTAETGRPSLERLVAALFLVEEDSPVTAGLLDGRRVKVILDTGGNYELLTPAVVEKGSARSFRPVWHTVSLDLGGFNIPNIKAAAISEKDMKESRIFYLGGMVLMQYRVTFDNRRRKVYLQFP